MLLAGSLPLAGWGEFFRTRLFSADLAVTEELVYSSNIDGVRESEATEEMEDYFLRSTLSLSLRGDLTRNVRLSSTMQLVNEKHFVRTDLDEDTLSDPFGQLDAGVDFSLGRMKLNVYGRHNATYEETEGQYRGPLARERVFHQVTSYGFRMQWQRRAWSWYADADATHDRYQEEEYQVGDSDDYTLGAGARWDVNPRVWLSYDYMRTREVLVNQEGAYDGWDHQQAVGANWLVLKRPNLTYTFAFQEETSQGETLDWQPAHTLAISDSWDLQPSLRLSADASYTHKEERGVNDVAFVYGATLQHLVSRTLAHGLRASREPVDTLGSTTDTDSTTVNYNLTKSDLFVYNLALAFSAGYRHDDPLGEGETEDTWSWGVSLTHQRRLTRKLNRSLSYMYAWEESSLADEPLEEHRVTLSFRYTF